MPNDEKKILIVDDEEAVRDVLVRWLIREGYSCHTAENGSIALKILEDENFSAMILDINMPELSGIKVLEQISLRSKSLPTIMISAVSNPEIARKTIYLGAYGYIIKPFEREEILINIENAMQRRRLEKDNQLHRDRLEELVKKRTREILDHDEDMEGALKRLANLMNQVVTERDFAVRFENPMLGSCYELLDCQKKNCPCYGKKSVRCWQVAGTFCEGEIQGEYTEKYQTCINCPVFQCATPDYTRRIGEHFNNMMNILEAEHIKPKNSGD